MEEDDDDQDDIDAVDVVDHVLDNDEDEEEVTMQQYGQNEKFAEETMNNGLQDEEAKTLSKRDSNKLSTKRTDQQQHIISDAEAAEQAAYQNNNNNNSNVVRPDSQQNRQSSFGASRPKPQENSTNNNNNNAGKPPKTNMTPGSKSSKMANSSPAKNGKAKPVNAQQQQAYREQQIPPKPPGSGQRPQTQSKQNRQQINQGLNKHLTGGNISNNNNVQQVRALSQNQGSSNNNNRLPMAQMPLHIQQQQMMIMASGQLPTQSQTVQNFYQSQPNNNNNFYEQQQPTQQYQINQNQMNRQYPLQTNNLMLAQNYNQTTGSSTASRGQQLSADKAEANRGRRQIITHILKMQNANSTQDIMGNPKQPYIAQTIQNNLTGESPLLMKPRDPSFSGGGGVQQQHNQANSMLQLKRKKIKELLMSGSQSRGAGLAGINFNLNMVEKEELQHQKRTLKLQVNVMRDENMRLKTRLAFMQQEMDHKDRDIESLALKMHQQAMAQNNKDNSSSNIGATSMVNGGGGSNSGGNGNNANGFESYLVNALKKQNREMRLDLEEKAQTIEKLKKDIKLTRNNEIEMELQSYIEECQRMRGMLEQILIQNQQLGGLAQTQHRQLLQLGVNNGTGQPGVNGNFVISEQAHIEDAFNEKETQLQREMQIRMQIQVELLQERQMRERYQKKLSLVELRLKKFNQVNAENERKRKIISDKVAELTKIKEEVEQLRDKARERDSVNNKNKELVTKYYGQSNAISEKDKRIQELKNENQKLQDQLKNGFSQKNSSTNNNANSPQRGGDTVKKVSIKAVDILPKAPAVKDTLIPLYPSPMFSEFLFRGLRKQPLSLGIDNPLYKTFFNQHADDLKRELEHLSKRLNVDPIRGQTINRLVKKLDIVKQAVKEGLKLKGVVEVERWVEQVLGIQEKDFKKQVIFNVIMSSQAAVKSINEVGVSGIIEMLKKEGRLPHQAHEDEGAVGDENAEEDYQDNQRGQASPEKEVSSAKIEQQNSLRIKQAQSSNGPKENFQQEIKVEPKAPQLGGATEGGSYEEDEFENHVSERKVESSRLNNKSSSIIKQQDNNDYEEDYEEEDNRQEQQLQPNAMATDEEEEQNYERDEFNNEGGAEKEEGEGGQQTIQITEDQMLDIAESVFQMIADRLKNMQISVKKAFAKRCSVVDEFEGETNVVVVQAADFLDALRNPPLNIAELTELEVACLMRVLSKPEIDHAILLNELNLVLENFGIAKNNNNLVEGGEGLEGGALVMDADQVKEDNEKRKQKQTKKKQIKMFIQSNGSPEGQEIFEVLRAIMERVEFNLNALMEAFNTRKYEQLVKSKKKEARIELIKREDFLDIIRELTQVDIAAVLPDNGGLILIELLSTVLQLDSKYSDVFQLKSVQQLLEEVLLRHEREEQDRRVMEDFYKPPTNGVGIVQVQHVKNKQSRQKELERVGELDEEPSGDNNTSQQMIVASGQNNNVEVLNFEELMSQEGEEMEGDGANPETLPMGEGEENDNSNLIMRGRPKALNEIQEEDAAIEDQNSPQHPSRQVLDNLATS